MKTAKINLNRENFEGYVESQIEEYAEFLKQQLLDLYGITADVKITNEQSSKLFSDDIPHGEEPDIQVIFEKWDRGGYASLPECRTWEEFINLFSNEDKSIPEYFGFDWLPAEHQAEIIHDLAEWFSYSANYAVWYETATFKEFNWYEGDTSLNHFPIRF